MFINPEDPRQGMARQQATLQQMLQQILENKRRNSMSRFAPRGQGRFPRGRRPLRGGGAGRYTGERFGGFANLLQRRGPEFGSQDKFQASDDWGFAPRIADPVGAESLEGYGPDGGGPVGNGAMQAPPGGFAYGGGPQAGAPSSGGRAGSDIVNPLSPDFGGLIPLGNGQWYDPATQSVMGRGGLRGMM